MFWLGLWILSASGLLLMGDVFLLMWEHVSRGESDIAVRGPFLLGLFVPYFAAAVATLVALTAGVHARRLRQSVVGAASLGVCLVLVTVVVLYVDPYSVALRVLSVGRSPLGRWTGYPGIVVADTVVVLVGLSLVARGFRTDRSAPA